MNIVIFSGGTGSIALQNGIKKIAPFCNITNIINLYDNGKSTGICREVCNVLGPSDLRKNHFIQYLNSHDFYNQNIVDFYEKRFDLKCIDNVLDILSLWGMTQFEKYAVTFFSLLSKRENLYNEKYSLKDFSLANIIYSVMFREIGYNKTIEYFENFLELRDNNVLINSYDNLFLYGVTKQDCFLPEEKIVCYNNEKDPIYKVIFTDEKRENSKFDYYENLNPDVISALNKADLIIYSSGTQWSSLIPTYANKEIMNKLKELSHKTIFIMNNEQDGDMKGMSSTQLVKYVEKYINLDKTKFIINLDANKLLKKPIDHHKNCYYFNLDNINGKHNSEKLAKAVFQTYFNLDEFDKIYMDFDDTIFSRNEKDMNVSMENCKLLKNISSKYKCSIISGNGYKNIYEKLSTYFGSDMDTNFDIWTDNGTIKYRNNKVVETINELFLKADDAKFIIDMLAAYGLFNRIQIRGYKGYVSCINIKPIHDHIYRKMIVDFLNDLISKHNWNAKAFESGTTSIDIINKNTSKLYVFEKNKTNSSIFIGDECESGNDKEIYKKYPENCIKIKNAYEMNILLRILQ